jgi:NADPH2:quinone reductase
MTTQARVVRFAQPGAPEVLKEETLDLADPGAGEVQIRQSAIGLNYMDVYLRSGLYPVPLPSGVGGEAAGVVAKVGPGVAGLAEGDRVCYYGGPNGAYASARNIAVKHVLKLPAGVTEEQAAASLLKGMTVEYLMQRCYPVKAGQFVLFYAASGGVGLLAGQWGKDLGARMIGVAGGADKCALARANGYEFVIDRTKEDIAARVKEITGGAGVPVAYDSVGKATYEATLNSLAPRGFFVSFGTTTGVPPAVEAPLLQKMGSLYFTRPTLVTYTATRAELEASASAVFDRLARGVLKLSVNQRYPLAEAARAHADLEAGRTVGSSILVP